MPRKRTHYAVGVAHLLRRRGKSRNWTGYLDGREVALGTPDADEAKRRLERLANERKGAASRALRAPIDGKTFALTRLVMSFTDVCKPPRYTPTTAKGYLLRLASFVEWAERKRATRAGDVTYELMQLFIAERTTEGVAASTINRELQALRTCFKHARRQGLIPADPFLTEDFRSLKLREPRPKPAALTLSPKQIDLALDVADKVCTKPVAALLRFTAGSGVRSAEAMHLESGDVRVLDTESGRAVLTIGPKAGWTTKGYRYRDVPISKRTVDAALEFIRIKGTAPTDAKTVWNQMRAVAKAAGVPYFSMHDLRRAWASAMNFNGASMKQVSVWLGHADVQTTERYVRVFDTGKTGHEFLPR